MSVLRTRYHKK